VEADEGSGQQGGEEAVEDVEDAHHQDLTHGQEDRRAAPSERAAACAARVPVEEPGGERYGEGRGKPCGEGGLPEEELRPGIDPVAERRLLEVAEPVEVRSDPVARGDHLPRDLRIADLVRRHQRTLAEREKVECDEERADQDLWPARQQPADGLGGEVPLGVVRDRLRVHCAHSSRF